jgi:hypothetical protein
MPIPVHDPLQFYVGDQWQIVFACHKSDGTVLDLTGATAEWRLDDFDGVNILTKTTADALAILPPATDGLCALTLDGDADTAAILPGYYRDQLRVVTGDGVRTTQSSGRIEAIESLA